MLKITCPAVPDTRRILLLEGRIVGPWVAELLQLCDASLQESSLLTLDLSGVSFVDRAGANLLHGLEQRRVARIGATPFVAEQLHGEGVALGREPLRKPGERS